MLLLDEPTNDLDVDTCARSRTRCSTSRAARVVISHDRWFLDRIATHILAFEGDSQVEWFEGNFQDYEADRHERLGADADQPHRIKYKKLKGGERRSPPPRGSTRLSTPLSAVAPNAGDAVEVSILRPQHGAEAAGGRQDDCIGHRQLQVHRCLSRDDGDAGVEIDHPALRMSAAPLSAAVSSPAVGPA